MGDLKSKRLIVIKGILFLFVAAIAFGLLLAELPTLRVATLLLILIWSSCRFYYFLFYVLERYVDSNLRYAGVFTLIRAIMNRRQMKAHT